MNLKNVDIEKLEQLPSHPKSYERVRMGTMRPYGRKDYNYRYPQKKQLASRIIKGHVGRPMSVLYPKIKRLLKGQNETATQFIDHWVEQLLFYNDKGIPIVQGDILYRSRRYHWDTNSDKYCDEWYADENNILRFRKGTFSFKGPKQPRTHQEHYAWITQQRKKYKERKEEYKKEGIFLINLINKPDLYSFYLRLKKEYVTLIRSINSSYSEFLEYKKSHGDRSIWTKWKYKEHLRLVKRIPETVVLKEQIEEIRTGNYKMFFDSQSYLYSQQKECHHFEIP